MEKPESKVGHARPPPPPRPRCFHLTGIKARMKPRRCWGGGSIEREDRPGSSYRKGNAGRSSPEFLIPSGGRLWKTSAPLFLPPSPLLSIFYPPADSNAPAGGGKARWRGHAAPRRARTGGYLGVRDLGGLLGQAAALRRDQVVVLGADVLVGVVEAAGTGPGGRPEGQSAGGVTPSAAGLLQPLSTAGNQGW